jgi:hypothetical protein
LLITCAIAFNSDSRYTEPVGLQGDENNNAFVFGVIAFSISSALTLKSLSMPAFNKMVFPSASLIISE